MYTFFIEIEKRQKQNYGSHGYQFVLCPQEGSVASSFFSLKYPVHDPGVWWVSSPGWGCGEGAGCGSGGGLGLR